MHDSLIQARRGRLRARAKLNTEALIMESFLRLRQDLKTYPDGWDEQRTRFIRAYEAYELANDICLALENEAETLNL
jgi:hypothetical protein